MIESHIYSIFHCLCVTYPDTDILITDKNKEVIFFRNSLNILDPKMLQHIKQDRSNILINEAQFHILALILLDEMLLFICAETDKHPNIHLLENVINNVAMIPFPKNNKAFSERYPNKYNLFIKSLISKQRIEENQYTSFLADEMNVDLSLARIVCVVGLDHESGDSGHTKNLLNTASSILRSHSTTRTTDIIGIVNESHLLFCKTSENSSSSIKNMFNPVFSQLKECLEEKLNIEVRFGVGFKVSRASMYPLSYSHAALALRNSQKKQNNVSYTIDHTIDFIIENSPFESLEHHLEPYADILDSHPTLIQTIGKLIEQNMNMTVAAKQLFIHRNTMLSRMKQIKELFNIDPIHINEDRFALHLIYSFYLKRTADS